MNTIHVKKVTKYFVLILITGVILTFITISVHDAIGQETSSNRQLNVIFDSIKINNDHDPLFPGEWKIDSYVNGQRTQLWIGSELNRVSTGETIFFREKNINVTIPENGTLRIVTVGAEFDIDLDDTLPNISGILDKDLPFLDCSESIDEEGDLYDAVDTSCDFRLRYTIKEKVD